MKKTYNKLTCLFGHHDYSDELVKDKYGCATYLCKVCKRKGYVKWDDGNVHWYDYDEDGNLIHMTRRWQQEYWYDTKGRVIHEIFHNGKKAWYNFDSEGNRHERYSDGHERWRNSGGWIIDKPENWKYEKV